jgi:hypothetical protein
VEAVEAAVLVVIPNSLAVGANPLAEAPVVETVAPVVLAAVNPLVATQTVHPWVVEHSQAFLV